MITARGMPYSSVGVVHELPGEFSQRPTMPIKYQPLAIPPHNASHLLITPPIFLVSAKPP